MAYQLLADTVLIAHLALVLFVVGGLVLIVAGNLLAWSWVNRYWFRIAHVITIAVVVGQSWFGIVCPLTTLESWLRTQAGEVPYSESFIEHWIQRVLFYDAPWWLFAAAYTAFGLLVALVWRYFPPKSRKPRR